MVDDLSISAAEPLLDKEPKRPPAADKRGNSGAWSEDGAGLVIALSLFAFSLVLSVNRVGSSRSYLMKDTYVLHDFR